MFDTDLRLAQLLCSRLCHDLVGPAGAVNAGLELAKEGGLDDGAMDLMTMSAGEITRRLAFFRIAFGAASGKASVGGGLSANDARALAEDLLQGGKVALDWPDNRDEPDLFDPAVGKVLLLLILIASESLPRGGEVAVHSAQLPEGFGFAIAAQGEGVRLKDDLQQALSGAAGAGADGVTARNVHAHYAHLLAAEAGGRLEWSAEDPGELRLMALFPAAG
ncbi:MAG: histidine phosphotransferase family protein [Rhodospirillaceae bacterium]